MSSKINVDSCQSNGHECEKYKPFLRWAGGKRWFLKHFHHLVDWSKINNYHEPFLGGGAVFFSESIARKSYLSDLNAELVETYISVRDEVDKIIDLLKTYENSEEFYYHIRSITEGEAYEKAARFIYLNQTSYNGLHRVNLNGIYNVPYGFRKNFKINYASIRSSSVKLQNAHLQSGDFMTFKSRIRKSDLIFLDPPYTVSHNNNGFISYNKKLFSLDDQKRLSKFIDYIKKKEAYYILTNAAHSEIRTIFDKGDNIKELSRASTLGGKAAKRQNVTEYLFTNLQ